MKREIRNASYRPFINNNESTSLTMSVAVGTYFEFLASLLMKWEAYVKTYLKIRTVCNYLGPDPPYKSLGAYSRV